MSETTSTTKKASSDSKSSSETKSDSTSSSSSETKSDSTSSSSSETKSDSSSTTSGGSSSKSSAPSRPISYFSSVSTEDYREGWDNIFQSKPKRPAGAKRAPGGAPRGNNGLVTIELSADDLDDELRAGLEAAFRAKAKGKRLGYDKLAAAGAVDWRLVCEIKR